MQARGMPLGYSAFHNQRRLNYVGIRVRCRWPQSASARPPPHQLKWSLPLPPRHQPIARRSLGDISGVFSSRGRDANFLGSRRGKPRQARRRCEGDVARCNLPAGVTRFAMITAIRLHSTAIRVNGIEFRRAIGSERVRRFKQDAAVAQNIGRQEVSGAIG